MTDQNKKKIYLVQFRTDASREHDQECYNDELKDCPLELVYLNAVEGDLPSEVPEDATCVIMGGSGQFYLNKEEIEKTDWIKETLVFLKKVLDKNIPFLGVCYGGHLLSYAEGADLSEDEALQEVGTFKVELLEGALIDPLFFELKQEFKAQFGHKTTPINLPKHLVQLARTEKVPCQAFRVVDKPAWAVMFHPELNRQRMGDRLNIFPNYVPKGMTIEELLQDFEDTPEAAKILHLFVEYAMKAQNKELEKIMQKEMIQA